MRVSSLWWRAPLLGALVGLPILGIGGRVAMRIIAMYTRPAPFLSFVTARGLHPVELLPLALFAPLVVLYGAVLERSWHRVWLSVSAASTQVTA